MIQKIFMERAIQLAKNGLGNVSPNPLVGCVIEKNKRIISEGWHYEYGKEHAEVVAINKVSNDNLLLNSTIYITLEPCSHFGKTPPCVDLIIKKRISRVVIGILDISRDKKGLGVKKLKYHGINVVQNFLKNECKILNKRFFTFHCKKRPFIILKWAQSKNGYISYFQRRKNISGIYTKQLNHKWRSEEDAILVGKNTVLIDNPKLNVREWYGKNPLRIFLDKNLKVPKNYFILDKTQKTVVFTEKTKKKENNIEYIKIRFNERIINEILYYLYEKKIQSLIIEGGKNIIDSFIKENIWDECRIFISNIFLENGIGSPIVSEKNFFSKKSIMIGKEDKLIIKYNYHI